MARTIPALIHIRPAGAGGRPSVPPPSSGMDDVSARTMPIDALRRELQSGNLPRDTEVLFPGLGDWTAASEVPELWVAPATVAAHAADESLEHDPTAPSIPVSSTSSAPRRRGLGAMAIFAAVIGALALLGVGAAAIYFVYFHYKPVAVQHLPRRCVVAARVDLLDLAFFDPLTKKLIPAIEDATRPPPPPVPPPVAAPSLKERLKTQANIDVDRGDVREVATCAFTDTTVPLPDPFAQYRAVIAVGGRFRAGTIPGLFEALRPELGPYSPRLDGAGDTAVIRLTFVTPGKATINVLIGQAEDGTLLIAPSDAALAAAREQRSEEEAHASTGLLQKGSIELAAEHSLFGFIFGLAVSPPAGFEPIFKSLANVHNGHVAITVGKSPKIELAVEHKSEAVAKDTENALRRLVEIGNRELSSIPKDWAGEHAALGGARVNRDDAKVDVKIDFRYPDVDRGAHDFGEQIKDPASPFRTKSWPVIAWRVGVGPKPASSAAPSSSAPPPPPPPTPDEGDD
jgi:hypothetical protein